MGVKYHARAGIELISRLLVVIEEKYSNKA